ncbi:MAG: lysozyme [Bacteroidetes bacterium]|nr:lysozyme [Bacteroidota bacterium]
MRSLFILLFIIFYSCNTKLDEKNQNDKVISNLKNSKEIDRMQSSNKELKEVRDFKISEKGMELLIKDLEGSSFKKRKVFLGSGNYLSIGSEYVLKKQDLYNKGILKKANLDIEEFLSIDFINFLKNKNFKNNLLKITKQEFNFWKNNNGLLKESTELENKRVFKNYLKNDHKLLISKIKTPLKQNEYDSIIAALYNLGFSNLNKSGFFELLNSNQKTQAALCLATIRQFKLKKLFPEFWQNGNIENDKLINLANSSKAPYLYGWIKRDFILANIFLNNLSFNSEQKPSQIFNINSNMLNIADKFWYLLKYGKHKKWIFNGLSGVKDISQKYLF